MPEALTPPQPENPITPDVVAQWMKRSDDIAPFDVPTEIDRGEGPEIVTVVDALSKRFTDEQGNVQRKPVVLIKNAAGQQEELDTGDYLSWSGFQPQSLEAATKPEDTSVFEETLKRPVIHYAGELASDHAADAAPVLTYEQRVEQRLRGLFAPVAIPETSEASEAELAAKYDHLLDPDYDMSQVSVSRAAVSSLKGREFISDKNIDQAVRVMTDVMRADSVAKEIITGGKTVAEPGADLVAAVRTDPELRYKLGSHYLNKIERYLDVMPSRVVANSEKNANYIGYGTLRSKEYVALLALSMLDGSFNYDSEEHLYEANERGIATIGQHRDAAKTVMYT